MVPRVSRLLAQFRERGLLSAFFAANQNDDFINVFSAISDKYYRETFHSDIIAFLLQPYKAIDRSTPFLHSFIDFLNRHYSLHIEHSNYSLFHVYREDNHFDIFIVGKPTTGDKDHSILIENKMNNAPDQPDQLPAYYLKAQSISHVDTVLYLSMDGLRTPDEAGWKSVEPERLRKKITLVGACTGKHDDLINGWLKGCSHSAEDPRYGLIAEQYAEMLRHLGGLTMPYDDIKKFYDFVLEDDNFAAAQALSRYMNELIVYRCRRVLETFQAQTSAFLESGLDPIDGFPVFKGLRALPDEEIKLLLIPKMDLYRIEIYNQNGDLHWPERVLREASVLDDFSLDQDMNRYFKEFAFPSEEERFYVYVRTLLNRIDDLKSSTI